MAAAIATVSPSWGIVITVDDDGPADHATIQAAVLAAGAGDEIQVAAGTYTLVGTLNVDKSLSIIGASEAGVIIDASANGASWGIHSHADNVTLSNFTMLPPISLPNNGGYAIHAAFTTPGVAHSGLTLENITIRDGHRTSFDIHGYDNVSLVNLTATGNNRGNGIQLSGCSGAAITGCTTSGNAWGGIAVYVSGAANMNRASSGISIDLAANSIGEWFYSEDEAGLVNSVNVSGDTYQIDNVYNPGTAAMHVYTGGVVNDAIALAEQHNTKYANSASVIEDLVNPDLLHVGGTMSLQAAVNAATAGDTIQINGNIALAGPVTVNKQLTFDGVDKTIAKISGSNALAGYFMLFSGASGGSVVQNISFEKTDKAGVQNMIGLQATNLTFQSCDFTGQYVLGDPDVSRAFEISAGATDFSILDCSVIGLRQPAYINAVASGLIQDTYVAGTRGWVIDGGLVTFTGNSWGQGAEANAVDIALLASTPYSPLYDPLSTLSTNNNGATISNQRAAVQVINLTQSSVHATIQSAIDAAVSGDSLEVYPGTFNESVTINKDIDLTGAGSSATVVNSTGNVISIPAAGSGATVTGIGVTGGARGFNLNGVANVLLDGVSSSGNTSFGINFDGANAGVALKNSSFSSNTSSGIKVGSSARVSNLAIDGCTVDGNAFGLYAADGSVATYQANAQLDGLTINNGSTFSNNTSKGLYIESMNNGLFDGIEVVNSGQGTSGGTGSGIDINLKYSNYSNLTIRNSLVSGCGQNYSFGGGILIKARSDGSYAANPATLGGTVLLEGLRVENNGGAGAGAGVRVGDTPNETSPSNVVIQNSTFGGNNQYAVLNLIATGAIDATHNHWSSPTGPIGATSNGIAGGVNFIPWYASSDGSTPPVLGDLRTGIIENIVIDEVEPNVPDLYIAPGTEVTVTPTGALDVTALELAEGATLFVNGGDLIIGDGSKISGTFTIFNSFGSWDINGDTTFEIGQSLALITDIHVAAGKTLTVNGGGELILDGCIIDSQDPGMPYNINVETDGVLTIARCVVSDAVIDIDTVATDPNLLSRIYSSSFATSEIEAGADARVFHNLFDAATDSASNTVPSTAFAAVDGWGNVTDAMDVKNRFSLNFAAPVDPTRTLDSEGNLFVRPSDPVVMTVDVGVLDGHTITAAEALLGYNSDRLTLVGTNPAVTPSAGWQVVVDDDSLASAPLGLIDSALGLELVGPGDDGISGPATIADVNFTAGTPGLSLGFFRVQTNGVFNPETAGEFERDTRLTKSLGGLPSFLSPFSENSGQLVIDNEKPEIATSPVTGTQVQPSQLSPVDVLVPAARVFRDGAPVTLTFTATDNGHGLAGLDAADVDNDLVLTASNGTTTLNSSNYTVTASDVGGVVTYTVVLNVPAASTTGTYTISATVQDRSGNVSDLTNLGEFIIANEAQVTVELEGFGGSTRDVTFVATGGSTVSWTKTVSFTGSVGTVILEDVPAGTTAISAKSAWTLRSKVVAAFTPEGVGTATLTGADQLRAGDLTGDNVVNTLDYSVLRFNFTTANAVADIDGSGLVQSGDYNLMVPNFYTAGDPQ